LYKFSLDALDMYISLIHYVSFLLLIIQ
jgi:hypothetical protein